MMRSPSNESLPGLQRPQYETRSRYRNIAGNGLGPSFYDFHGTTNCSQEVNLKEIHLNSVKIKDLGSCLVPTSTNMSGVQISDDVQNIQKTASFMRKNRDFNLQNLRKSPRLSVQNTEDKYVFESNQEGVKCRSNSQIEGLDKKEVTLAKSPQIDYQTRSVEHEQETNLRNVRKSPRFSEESRERDMQLLFGSTEKITNCKKKSRIKEVDQEKFIFPAEGKLVNMAKVHEESSNDEGKRGVQDVQTFPRVSGKVPVTGLQSFIDSSSKGICTHESHVKSIFKSNLSLKTKATPASLPHIPNTGVSYGRIMNSQSIRKSVRFSGKHGEMDLQTKNLPSEFSFATDVELTTVIQVHNKSSDCNNRTDLKTMQKSLRLSCRSRETNLDRNIECSEEGRTESLENSSHLNTLSAVKVFNKPQVQNVSANSIGHVELKNMQKLTHLSGTKRLRDLQICSRKEFRLGAESRKRGRPRKNFSLTSEVDLTNAPSAQNQTVKPNEDEITLGVQPQKKGLDEGTMSLPIEVELTSEPSLHSEIVKADGCLLNKGKRGRPRKNFSLTSKVDLTNAPSAQNQTVKPNEDEINLGVEPQKKGFDRGTMSLPIEVELTSEPSLHSEIVKADGCLLNKATGSPLNSSKSLPLFQYYVSSGKGINLVVDLNSSPSDWNKKIFSSSSQSLQKNKFECFRHEIELLRSKKMISSLVSTTNPSNKIIPSHLQNNACSQLVSEETCPLRSYIPERDNGSSDITQTNSCIDVRTRDGHVENSSDVNTETSGDNISSYQEYRETRITILETKASEQPSENPMNTIPDGSHKRKKIGRKICGMRLKCGKHLGTRKSMRLWHQGGPR